MNLPSITLLLMIGLVSGTASGLFGIGGGVLIVPALLYWAGFSKHAAIGTSLAILLPPVGLAAVIEYYRHGNVDLKAAFIVAAESSPMFSTDIKCPDSQNKSCRFDGFYF